ncbi:MAG TPA: hypothetical protein VNL73_07745 [Verrucomicrobiae bacterium]|nr:hypothetical protein [Verrucomicrobiae bacterium]
MIEGNDIQFFSPETQIAFRLPHAGPVVPSSSNRSGQEARRPTGRELPTGDNTNPRDGRDAGGIRFKRPECRRVVKAARRSRRT